MTSKTVPIYRHGRKFYVSAEEYARIRAEEQRHRRTAVQKSHHLPVSKSQQGSTRVSSVSSYNPVQRSHSNPYEHIHGILKPSPAPTFVNAVNRYEPNRISRSILKRADDQSNVISLKSTTSKKLPSMHTRSNSSDKVVDLRKTPLTVFDPEDDLKPSASDETAQLPATSVRQSPPPSRRIAADYGISPTTTLSMTPTDQTHTQTSSLKLSSYLTRTKQSSLNPPSATVPGTGPFLETGIQGSTQTYAMLGSSTQRTNPRLASSVTRSVSESRKSKYHHRNAPSESFADDYLPALGTHFQPERAEFDPYAPSKSIGETDVDPNQQHDRWMRSTHRSQSTDGLLEKKRVRFADTEGLTLESKSDRNNLFSPTTTNSSSSRRSQAELPSDARGRPRPFYNTLYQATTNADGSRLATDV